MQRRLGRHSIFRDYDVTDRRANDLAYHGYKRGAPSRCFFRPSHQVFGRKSRSSALIQWLSLPASLSKLYPSRYCQILAWEEPQLRLSVCTMTNFLKVHSIFAILTAQSIQSNLHPGIAVSSTGRKFSNYARSLDPNNIAYTVAELKPNNTEIPYPSAEINSPPGGAINHSTTRATGANYENYLIGVQSVVIDPLDRLWILDTGRAAMQNGTNVASSVGGPKLIGVNLQNDTIFKTIFKTILFPPNVVYSDSYINDIRFDLRLSVTASGQGVGYITDSSQEGRNGIVVVDLGTGKSWRHLDGTAYVHPRNRISPSHLGSNNLFAPQRPLRSNCSKHLWRRRNSSKC